MSTIKLLAQDGEMTEVELEVARISPTIRAMLDNLDEEGVLPLPNISTPILKKVMEWVAHHKDDYPLVENDNEEVAADVLEDAWDTQFLQMDGSRPLLGYRGASKHGYEEDGKYDIRMPRSKGDEGPPQRPKMTSVLRKKQTRAENVVYGTVVIRVTLV
ncbi:S-phase kinase-associated protein 1, partial [Orchesella cincta]